MRIALAILLAASLWLNVVERVMLDSATANAEKGWQAAKLEHKRADDNWDYAVSNGVAASQAAVKWLRCLGRVQA